MARIAVLALLGVIGLSSAALSQTAEKPTDIEITNAIEVALRVEPRVSPHLMDVTTTEGVVTLSGTASNLLERDRAVKVTETVKGVRSIVNRLEVRAVERSDAEIRKDVRRALALDPATDTYEVDVQVQDAVVTLTGSVESWSEKLLAAQVAKGVKGVRDVKNEIDYSYSENRSDQDIKADIEGRLEMDPYIDEGLIDVTVSAGAVTLRGTVGSLAEKRYAVTKAHVPGTTRVMDDDLIVSRWAQGAMERTRKIARVTDAEARAAIEKALLYDPRVLSLRIAVSVENGEATLTGTVENLKAKRVAGRDARNTMGIWKVNNEIKVRPIDTLTDAEIARNVREALMWDPIVERFEIAVTVRNRLVSLTGTVDTPVEKRHAEDVASRVTGVASVSNRLAVEYGWVYKPDSEIKQDIESEYAWSPFVDGGDLELRVDSGHVELVGSVDTWHEYLSAVENAFEGGATSVRSYMRVEANGRMYDREWSRPPSEQWPF